MKFLYHHRIRSKDGQAVHLEELVGALRASGHEVVIAGPEAFAQASFGHDPKFLGFIKRLMPKPIYEVLELGYNIPAYRRLHRAWREHKPDVVYERYNLYLLAGLWLRKRTRTPVLLEVNGPLFRERSANGGLGLPRLARRLEQWVWRNADFVLPVTRVLAEEIRAAGVREERIVVIPNAIDAGVFMKEMDSAATKKALGLSNKIVLGFAGFVRDWHGLDAVIDWLGSGEVRPDLHLLILGEGPALAGLRSQAESLGISDRITFAGLVDRKAIANMVGAFDVALQPKSVDYASPLKLFEYMALGKAIVAPDQPNIREVLADSVSGLLFDPAKKDSMTTAIARLCNDSELRARLGENARDTILARGFTWKDNARRVAGLVERTER